MYKEFKVFQFIILGVFTIIFIIFNSVCFAYEITKPTNFVKPNRLKIGDTIGIIAPSGSIDDNSKFLIAKKYFENQGYKIKTGKYIYNVNRYLAGSDEEKVSDLHDMFLDKNVKAIICLRGGYGSIRLLDKIDYNIIKRNPKIFAGHSDITALLNMITKKTGLITYNSPMIIDDFGVENPSKYTLNSFFETLTKNKIIEINTDKVYKAGKSEGIIFGGNLSTINSLCGLDFVPNEKFIFIVEDVNEPVYKIDKMFTQLFKIKQFRNNLNGIVLGEFAEVDNKEWLEDLFKEISNKYDIPVISVLNITHGNDKLTIPIGARAKINGNKLIIY